MLSSKDTESYHREMVAMEVKCLDKITSHIETSTDKSIPDSVYEPLSNEINSNLDKLTNLSSQLSLLAISQPKIKQEVTLSKVEWHEQQIQHIRATLRRLTMKRSEEQTEVSFVRRRKKNNLNSESELIHSLEETRRMLATQLRHSEDTFEALVESSSTLEGVNTELEEIGGSVDAGRYLVNMLRDQRFKAKVKVTLAMVVFVLTCVNIVVKRLFPFLYPF
ncbi:vesicle transport protein SEC20-like [Oopsacas minuta]|uniref:Vesicle transport protein SEC20-like n=1 Tax=Oopsacas minuta TaxID=111878 RepID=A0AAV7K369_9METZ|nr:vesicle transport protein SEC20-like [Oopsacas minuta]